MRDLSARQGAPKALAIASIAAVLAPEGTPGRIEAGVRRTSGRRNAVSFTKRSFVFVSILGVRQTIWSSTTRRHPRPSH